MKIYLILENNAESAAIVLNNVDVDRLTELVDLCNNNGVDEVRISFDDYELRAIDSFPEPPADGHLGDNFVEQAEPGEGELHEDDWRLEYCRLEVSKYGIVQFFALPKHYNDEFSTETVQIEELKAHG